MGEWRNRLRKCIDDSGRNRFEITQEAGLNPAYITQVLEKKGATPRTDNLQKLAEVLGTTVSYLSDGVDMSTEQVEVLALFSALDLDRRRAAVVLMRDLAAESK